MSAAIACLQTSGQGINDCALVISLNRTIATKNPNDCLVLVSPTQVLTILLRGSRIEDSLAGSPVAAPGRKQSDKHAEFFCLVNNEINVAKVRFIGFG